MFDDYYNDRNNEYFKLDTFKDLKKHIKGLLKKVKQGLKKEKDLLDIKNKMENGFKKLKGKEEEINEFLQNAKNKISELKNGKEEFIGSLCNYKNNKDKTSLNYRELFIKTHKEVISLKKAFENFNEKFDIFLNSLNKFIEETKDFSNKQNMRYNYIVGKI